MTFLKAWIVYKHGGFQLELVSISQVINHMTGYKSALIGWNYSIQTGEQILYMIFFLQTNFPPMKALKFIIGHAIYHLAFTYNWKPSVSC